MFKLAAIAAAMLATLVACTEKEDEGPITIEGKQWICEYDDFEHGMIPGVIDLGCTDKGKINFGIQIDGEWVEPGYLGKYDYTIEEIDATSGWIVYSYVHNDKTWVERIGYKDLTRTTVTLVEYDKDPLETSMFWINYDKPATASKNKITIKMYGVE